MTSMVRSHISMIDTVDQVEIDPDAYSDIRVGEIAQYFIPAALVNDAVPAEGFVIVLAVADLDMRDQFSSFPDQIVPSSQKIPGRPHFCRVDIGQRECSPLKDRCDLPGINSVVLGFSSMNGFHVQRMSENERDPFFCAEVCDPVPCKNAFNSYHYIVAIWLNGFQQGFRFRFHVLVQNHITI